MEHLLEITPYTWIGISTCVLCGFMVGLERQLRGKPVGIRTSSLIVLGTYLFVEGASSVSSIGTDDSRVIGQVVTGVGFLGAGVMMSRDGVVVGVTSAATIWALAAIGVSIAIASPATAIKLSLLVVGILYGVDMLEDFSTTFTRGAHARYSSWRTGDRRRNDDRKEQ